MMHIHIHYNNIHSVAKGKLQCGQCVNCLLKNDSGKCRMCLDKKVWWTWQEKATLYDEKMQKHKAPEICTQR